MKHLILVVICGVLSASSGIAQQHDENGQGSDYTVLDASADPRAAQKTLDAELKKLAAASDLEIVRTRVNQTVEVGSEQEERSPSSSITCTASAMNSVPGSIEEVTVSISATAPACATAVAQVAEGVRSISNRVPEAP